MQQRPQVVQFTRLVSRSEGYLKGPQGDRINAVLAAAGYNFSLLLRWLAEILRACIIALARQSPARTV